MSGILLQTRKCGSSRYKPLKATNIFILGHSRKPSASTPIPIAQARALENYASALRNRGAAKAINDRNLSGSSLCPR